MSLRFQLAEWALNLNDTNKIDEKVTYQFMVYATLIIKFHKTLPFSVFTPHVLYTLHVTLQIREKMLFILMKLLSSNYLEPSFYVLDLFSYKYLLLLFKYPSIYILLHVDHANL